MRNRFFLLLSRGFLLSVLPFVLAQGATTTNVPVVIQQAEVLPSSRNATAEPLLFPFATNQIGYDTEITISNTSQDTLGSTAQPGTCTLNFSGSGAPTPAAQTSGSIPAGQQLIFKLSQGGGGIAGAPGFQGYITANCTFRLARGFAKVIPGAPGAQVTSYAAQVITGTPSAQPLLFPFVTSASGFDTGFAIANTSNSSGSCTLSFYGAGAPTPSTGVAAPGGSQAAETVNTFLLSSVAPGFTGYVIANCNFAGDAGFAFILSGAGSAAGTGLSETAEQLTLPRSSTGSSSLLFPSVTSQNGNDTGIVIDNTTSDPFGVNGATPASGTCTLDFYGSGAPTPSTGVAAPGSYQSGVVNAFLLSGVAPGFQGYVIATCTFPDARGYSYIASPGFPASDTDSITPAVVTTPRSTTPATTALLFSAASNWNGNDTNITISNTSSDPFGTTGSAGACTINYYGGTSGGGTPPASQTSNSIPAGGQLTFSLSQGNTAQGINATPGFRGYVIAGCSFPLAAGVATITGAPPGDTVNVTITTTPPGLFVTVDGTQYNSAQTFAWVPGSSHTLFTSSPQVNGGSGYNFTSWSNGGGQTQPSLTAPAADETLTATFTQTSAPVVTGFANGADGSSPPLAPGSFASLFGANLAAASMGVSGPPLGTTLGTVSSLKVNGRAAPLFFVSPTEVNFQIPYETPLGSNTVVLTNNGTPSNSITLTVAATAPGFYSSPALQNANGTTNSSGNPAPVGSVVAAYLTGVGAVNPGLADGAGAGFSPNPVPVASSSATIGGVAATIFFFGLVPSNVGIAQANVAVPTSLAPGSYPLVITVGGVATKAATVYVNVAPVITGVSNMADQSAPPLAPGSGAVLSGLDIAASTVQAASGAPFPTTLGNVTITVNGRLAPISYVTPTFADFQIPYETATGTATVVVTNNGVASYPSSFQVAATAPGILADVQNDNSSAPLTSYSASLQNSSSNPAAPGFFLDVPFTGGGAVTPVIADGARGSASPSSVPVAAVSATLGGTPAPIQFIGLTQGLAGFINAVITVPASLAPGSYPLVVTVGGVASKAATVYVGLSITSGPNYGTFSVGDVQAALVATGGTPPYTWSLASGSPPGLYIRTGADMPSFFPTTASAGIIGVATAPNVGASSFGILVTDSASPPNTATQTVASLTVTGLTITDPYTLPDGFLNVNFSWTLNAAGNTGPVTWDVVGCSSGPNGLSVVNGVITGTPTVTGPYNCTLSATDSTGTVYRGYSGTIYGVGFVGSGALGNLNLNTAIATPIQINGQGGTPPYTFIPNPIVPGLSISTTGAITGTPTCCLGSYFFDLTIADSAGHSYVKQFVINLLNNNGSDNVPQMTVPVPANDATVGEYQPYSNFAVYGGKQPYTWSAVGLPAGMQLVTSAQNPQLGIDAQISGAALALGTYSATVSVTDSSSPPVTVEQTYTFKVKAIDNQYPSNPTLGTPYSFYLRPIGGSAPFTWAQVGGVLPQGLNLNTSTGVISGTPQENGNFSPTFTITSSAASGSLTLTRQMGFNVNSGTTPQIQINNPSQLPDAQAGVAYSYQLNACCGTGAITWTGSINNPLPTGLTLGFGTGVISGTPTAAQGPVLIEIFAHDTGSGNGGMRYFTINVSPITTNMPTPNGFVGTAYSTTFTASGGTGPYTWALAPNSQPLPANITLSPGGVLSGTPTSASVGGVGFNYIVTDSASHTFTGSAFVSIYPAGDGPPLSFNPAAGSLGAYPLGTLQIPFNASGGNSTSGYSWSVATGTSLPPGLNFTVLSFSSGVQFGIAGVARAPGNYSFGITVTSGTQTLTQNYTVAITATTIKDTYNLPDGFANAQYSYTFTALNNGSPVVNNAGLTFTSTSPALPGTMTVSPGGVLSGTAPAGSYQVNFSVNDGTNTIFRGYQLNIYALNITTASVLPNQNQNATVNQTISATGGTGALAFTTSGGLPNGLSLGSGGSITGTLSSGPGVYQFYVTVSDTAQNSYQKRMSMDIIASPATLPGMSAYSNGSGILDDVTVGNSYSNGVSVCCGGTAPFTWTASGLPQGMSIRFAPGFTSDYIGAGDVEIWGVASTPGAYNVQLTVTDANGVSASNTFPLHVSQLDLEPSLPNGTLGSLYSSALFIRGGPAFFTGSIVAGALPAGLTFSTAAGTQFSVSGTPTENGSFNTTLLVADSNNNTLRRTNYFTINNTANNGIVINNGSNLGSFTVGGNYSNALTACCVANYTWSFAGGTPPPGMELLQVPQANPNSVLLAGTLGVPGTYTFLVEAADAANVAPPGFRQFTLIVTPISITTNNPLPTGNVGSVYGPFSFTSTGGTAPISCTVTGNSLPPGLTLGTNGAVTGSPTSGGQYNFTVTATDSANPANTASRGYSLNIYLAGQLPPLAITTGANLGTVPIGQDEFGLLATGGNGTYVWSVATGSTLPPGMALRTDKTYFTNPAAQAVLMGVPTATVTTTYNFTLNVTSAGQMASQEFSLTLSPLNFIDTDVPDAFAGNAYSYQFTALNNVQGSTVTYSLAGGSSQLTATNNGVTIHSGLTVSSTGLLSGTALTPGAYPFNLTLTNGTDTITTFAATLNVYAVDITTPGMLPNGTQGNAYPGAQLAASGGSGTYTWTASGLPSGLVMSTGGSITGTVNTGPGHFQVNATATDTQAHSYVKTMSIDVVGSPATLPQINIGEIDDASYGLHYNWSIGVAGGTAPYTWSATGLPTGMSVRYAPATAPALPLQASNTPSTYVTPGNVEIYGLPQQTGNFTPTLTVTDATGARASVTFPFHVAVTILRSADSNSQGMDNGTIGTPYSFQLRVLGGTPGYTILSQVAGKMPDGLTVNFNTLQVTGTPKENGSFNPVFVYADSANTANTLQVGSGISIGDGTSTVNINNDGYYGYNLGTATVNQSYSTTFSGGPGGLSWASADHNLPPGLTISSNGTLSGTPTTVGTYSFLVEASVGGTNTGFKQFTLTVTPITVTVNGSGSSTLPFGNVSAPYSQTLTPVGNTGTVIWSLINFSVLPPGLTLSPGGLLSGAPTVTGQYSFTIQGQDSATTPNIVIRSYTLNIYAANSAPPVALNFTPGIVAVGPATFLLNASGGANVTAGGAMYHYLYSPGATPIPGMRVQDTGQPMPTNFFTNGSFSATNTGGLIGVLTAPGTYTSSIRATDSTGANFIDRAFTLTVSPLNILDQTSLPRVTVNSAFNYQLNPTGGISPYVFTTTAFFLPPGISLSSTGQFTGTPTQAGTYNASFTLGDAIGNGTISLAVTIIVDPFAITSPGVLPQGTVGHAYNQTLTAPNCGTGCTWNVLSGSLPAGLSLSSAGVLSGTDTNTTGAVTSFTVQASGSAGTVQKVFALIIPPSVNTDLSITTSFTTTPTVGGISAAALTGTGGTPPYTFRVLSSSLTTAQSGISLQGTGDTISATLAPGFYYLAGRQLQVGPINFNVRVTDANNNTATKALTWTISPLNLQYASLPITGTSLVYEAAYTQQLLVLGGSGSYNSWTLPQPIPGYPANTPYPSLTLNSTTGLITGAPASTGSITQPVMVTDTNSASMTQNLSINASSASSGSTVTLGGPAAGAAVPLGATNLYTITPSGGTGPYTITPVGNLPSCASVLILNGDSLTPGFTSAAAAGTTWEMQVNFQQAGPCVFTLQAADSSSTQIIGAKTYTFAVSDFSNTLTTTLNPGSVGAPYSQQLYAFGGSNVQWTLASGSALPPGNPAFAISPSGLLTGTPTRAGNYLFTATYSDAAGSSSATFTLNISALTVTSASILPVMYNNVNYNFTFTATGGTGPYTWTVPCCVFAPNNVGLGPILNSSTGVLSGLPSGDTPGISEFSVTVTDSSHPANSTTVPATLYLEEQNPGLLSYLGTTALPDAVQNQVYAFQLTNLNGGVPPYTLAAASGSSLPPGLSLLSGAGNLNPGVTEIAGQPSQAGQFTFSLTIADSKGSQITRAFTLNVAPLNLTSGNNTLTTTVGAPYQQQFSASSGSGSYTYAISGTSLFALSFATQVSLLPQGMSFGAPNCSAGQLCGTPAFTGNYQFKLTVTDNANSALTLSRIYTLIVSNANGLYVNNSNSSAYPGLNPLQGNGNGKSFSASTTTGPASTYTWEVASGSLPPGLTLASSGQLTGSATTPGTYTFAVQATDTANNSNVAVGQTTFIVSTMQEVFPAQNTIVGPVLPTGMVGQPYLASTNGYTFGMAGGTPPYTFQQPPLPTGMTLSTGGVLSGTPTQSGDFNIQPIVTDGNGNIFINSSVTLSIAPAGKAVPLNTSGNGNAILSDATIGSPYLAQIDRFVTGGTPPYTWSVANGSTLPPGISIIPGSNGVANYLGGVPTALGPYTFTLNASDSGTPTQTLPVTFYSLGAATGGGQGSMNVSVLGLSPGVAPLGLVGSPFSLTFNPSGGTGPYTLQLFSGGSAVPGLSLSGNTVTGVPTSPGLYYIGVIVTDSAGTLNTLDRIYEIEIDDALGEVPALSVSPQPVTALYIATSGNLPQVPIDVNSSSHSVPFDFSVLGLSTTGGGAGTTSATESITFNSTSLTPGTYFGIAAAANAASGGLGSQAVNSDGATPVLLTVLAPPPCSYTINPGSLSVGAAGTPTSTFDLTTGSGCAWTAAPDSNSPWIGITNIPPASGSGTVQFSVTQNTGQSQRSGTIVVSAAGNTQQTFTVTQFGLSCSFSLTPATLNVPANFNGGPISATITVNASDPSCAWPASSGLSVVTPATPAGNGQATVTIPVNNGSGIANPNPTAIIAGQILTVIQGGAACNITLGSSSANYDANGAQGASQGSVTLNGAANCPYITVSGPGWIQVTSGSSGNIGAGGTATLTYNVNANSTTATRSGSLLIAGQQFQITEQGLACSISLNTSGLPNPLDMAGATPGTIGITTNGSNCQWTASSNSSFATVSPPSGSGNGQVTVTVTSNAASTTARGGSVTISGQNVGISQAGTTCTFQLLSSTGSVPAAGGVGTVDVVAPSACSWTAASNSPSVTINSGASSNGSAEVQYIVAPNTSAAPPSPTLTLTVAGNIFIVNQAGATCSFTLGTSSVTMPVANTGVTGATVGVSTALTGCATPTVTSYANWITNVSVAFTGSSGTVTYTAGPNSSGAQRSGNIQVGDQVFVVTEAGANCAFSLNAYSAGYNLLGGAGSVLASPNPASCPAPVPGVTQSFISLGTLTGPASNIYTQPFTVSPFNSAVKATRKGQITLGGQTFTVKQTSY